MGKETNNAATPEQAPVPKSVLAAAPVAAMTSTGAHASAETTGLESPVSAVAGVGSARARLLAKRGIVTVGDLLLDAPRRTFTITGGERQSIDGRSTRRVQLVPKSPSAVPFSKAVLWLDDTASRPVRVQVLDQQGVDRTITLTSWAPDAVLQIGRAHV